MSNLMYYIRLIPSILCIVTASYLVINHMQDWGWFLFAAVILAAIGLDVRFKKNDS